LRRLALGKIETLPPETHDAVQSVTFQSARPGQPLDRDCSLGSLMVRQVYDPWLLIELKDAVDDRHIAYLFSETGQATPFGNFNQYSRKPGIELVDELVDSIDFYERLLLSDTCASEVSIRTE
jgi:hypothetical protein